MGAKAVSFFQWAPRMKILFHSQAIVYESRNTAFVIPRPMKVQITARVLLPRLQLTGTSTSVTEFVQERNMFTMDHEGLARDKLERRRPRRLPEKFSLFLYHSLHWHCSANTRLLRQCNTLLSPSSVPDDSGCVLITQQEPRRDYTAFRRSLRHKSERIMPATPPVPFQYPR